MSVGILSSVTRAKVRSDPSEVTWAPNVLSDHLAFQRSRTFPYSSSMAKRSKPGRTRPICQQMSSYTLTSSCSSRYSTAAKLPPSLRSWWLSYTSHFFLKFDS